MLTIHLVVVMLLLQEGSTPLHYACARGKVEVARLLLDAGAAVDAIDKLKPLLQPPSKVHVT